MDISLTSKTGSPQPFGAAIFEDGINFAVYSTSTIPLKLYLHAPYSREILGIFEMSKTGSVHHLFIKGATPPLLYSYHTDADDALLDPYAIGVDSGITWNQPRTLPPLMGVALKTPYDWENDRPLNYTKEELIIYEMHVRGFTQDPSSRVHHPGTYLGMIEKIPHLKELGINAVELLPIFEFNETEYQRENPQTHQRLCNYWGYSTLNFFTPMNRYASEDKIGAAHKELKDLVKELHKNNIEVYLDVVYNHTGEGNQEGITLSFRGLDHSIYYMLDEKGEYLCYSGCGNTFNCNAPAVQELILNSLRYWVSEFHIDGFRFDLASILTRGSNGKPLASPPLIEAITQDPILANVKLIAEAWDAAGLYQVGKFHSEGNRWSEWNGVYRDSVRRFIKGTSGVKGDFATRLCGSRDLYYRQNPSASVNFVTCHDGFSLADLVSYNQKHNQGNGENNQDGSSWNDSWNCGVEGETNEKSVLVLREKQMRNFHVALMVSQGIPLLNMGDEYAHSKKGNNNTWCQDNSLSWFLWNKLEENPSFFRFYKKLIAFRKDHRHFHHKNFIEDVDVIWHGSKPNKPDWSNQNSLLAFELVEKNKNIYIAFNPSEARINIELPANHKNGWQMVVNTANLPPLDFYDPPVKMDALTIAIQPFSSLILYTQN